MPVLSTSQESGWDSNIYVVTTTRVLVLVGTAYLVRSLYNLVSATWGSRSASNMAGEPASVVADAVSGLVLEELNLDITQGPASTGLNLEANISLSEHPPHRSYGLQDHIQRSQTSPRVLEETPHSSGTPNTPLEQDVGVRHGTCHLEENMESAVGFVR